jgi:hypothetical protein
MKQTAVEWLLNKIESKNGKEFSSYYTEFIEQAKEMEKEQIIDAYCKGSLDMSNDENIFPRETSEQYYNESFNK